MPRSRRPLVIFDCSIVPAKVTIAVTGSSTGDYDTPIEIDDVDSTIYETSLCADSGDLRATLENNWIDTDEY